MLVHIPRHSHSRHHTLLRAVYRQRKVAFIDRMNWPLTPVGDEERDDYDAHADYLILLDDTGDVAGSARFLPTTGPHLMADHFGHLCADGAPRGAHIWELSRLCYNPFDQSGNAAARIRQRLALAMLEVAIVHGIEQLVFVTHMAVFTRVLGYGWNIRPLGPPTGTRAVDIGAFSIDVDAASLRRMRANFGIYQPIVALSAAA
ncbi:acyl-homoserine-lactone synthase [Parapedomonas caeni]|jgi:acyl homoserine lactone synthase/acyl-homoserine lactone synthase